MDRFRRPPGARLHVALAAFLLLSLLGAGIGTSSALAADLPATILDHDAAEAETAFLPAGILPLCPALRAARISAAPSSALDAARFCWDGPPRAPPDPIQPV